ncbi:hypothetical protein LCGC14_2770310, partial [marine sediment metagenome]
MIVMKIKDINMSVIYNNKKYKVTESASADLGLNRTFKTLDLRRRVIADLTVIKGLSKLEDLQVLRLDYCELSDISGLDGLSSLLKLTLTENKITEIGGLSSLQNLEILHLHNNQHRVQWNQIHKIKGLSKLLELRVLNLSFNKIEKIEGLNSLKKLQVLNLSGNKIKKIEGLDNLTNLRELQLQRNHITTIQGLENLTKLNHLNISFNLVYKWAKKQFKVEKLGYHRFRFPQSLVDFCQRSKEYKNQALERIKDILQFEYEHQRDITKVDLIRSFNLNFDEAENYLRVLNSPQKNSLNKIKENLDSFEEKIEKL